MTVHQDRHNDPRPAADGPAVLQDGSAVLQDGSAVLQLVAPPRGTAIQVRDAPRSLPLAVAER